MVVHGESGPRDRCGSTPTPTGTAMVVRPMENDNDDQDPVTDPENAPETHVPSFQGTMETSGRLHAFADALGAIVSETRLTVGSDGLVGDSVDPAHVVIVRVRMDASAWDTWTASGDDDVVGLDVETLQSILKGAGVKDPVGFALDGDTEQFEGSVKGLMRTFDVIPGADMVEPNTDNLPELPLSAHVPVEEFYDFIRQAGEISDHCALYLVNGTFRAVAINDSTDARIEWTVDNAGELGANGRALYSLDYLKSIVYALKGRAKAKRIADPDDCIQLDWGTDNPVRFSAERDGVSATYWLAPRIESNSGDAGYPVPRTDTGGQEPADAPETMDPTQDIGENAGDETGAQGPNEGEAPPVDSVVSFIAQSQGDSTTPWEDVLAHYSKQGYGGTEIEAALNEAMDQGRIYEPILGRLKVS